MKTIVLTVAMALSLISCNAQEEKKEQAKADNLQTEVKEDEVITPKGSWKVTKEMDEQGNIVKYDSVYSYSYNTLNGEEVNIEDVDSVIKSFRSYFQDRLPSQWDPSLMSPFWNNSPIEEDFFDDKFFQDRWKADFEAMNDRMKKMDSLRNAFFDDFYPGLKESRKPQKDLEN